LPQSSLLLLTIRRNYGKYRKTRIGKRRNFSSRHGEAEELRHGARIWGMTPLRRPVAKDKCPFGGRPRLSADWPASNPTLRLMTQWRRRSQKRWQQC